jgi:hypothetical protein
MKKWKIEHIIYTGWNKEKNEYNYSVYCEDDIYKFIIQEKQEDDSRWRSIKNEYKIFLDMSSIVGNQLIISLCSSEPSRALCDYLNYDFNKFKNDIYVNVDKKYLFDYLKEGIDDYGVSLPINSVFTPNTNLSDSDTICALLDKEYDCLDGDDSDFTRDVFSKILNRDKIYVQPFIDELVHHMFYEFLTDDEMKQKPKDRPIHFINMKDKFERKFKSYDDEIEFKRTIEDFEDSEKDYSIEKIEFTIKHNIHYKNPYKNFDSVDSNILSTSSMILGATASLFTLKKGLDFIKSKK